MKDKLIGIIGLIACLSRLARGLKWRCFLMQFDVLSFWVQPLSDWDYFWCLQRARWLDWDWLIQWFLPDFWLFLESNGLSRWSKPKLIEPSMLPSNKRGISELIRFLSQIEDSGDMLNALVSIEAGMHSCCKGWRQKYNSKCVSLWEIWSGRLSTIPLRKWVCIIESRACLEGIHVWNQVEYCRCQNLDSYEGLIYL